MNLAAEEAKALQRDVQRLLGRCMLRLQQYERLLKDIVAHHEFSGPVQALDGARKARVDRTARQTLGALVGELFGSYLVGGATDTEQDPMDEKSDDVATVSVRMRLSLSEEDFARTETELADLVRLRNDLVHHFIDQHDLWSADGCRRAQEALTENYDRIDQCFGRLVDWAKDMDRMMEEAGKALQTEWFRNVAIHGIMPDGTVDWPASSLVSGFREAARALAGDKADWVAVADAGRWIVAKYPDQTPARFGCKTWQQALQESGRFDLRYDMKDGRRMICFKEKANPRVTNAPERTWEFNPNGPMVRKP